MIKYQIIILLISFLYINNSSEDDCFEMDPSKKKVCHDKTVSNSGYYCCYIKYKSKGNGQTYTLCSELSSEEKKDIDKAIEELESEGADVKNFDCKSSYLELGLLSIIFLLL